MSGSGQPTKLVNATAPQHQVNQGRSGQQPACRSRDEPEHTPRVPGPASRQLTRLLEGEMRCCHDLLVPMDDPGMCAVFLFACLDRGRFAAARWTRARLRDANAQPQEAK
jgi:hypothetical protein